MTKSEIRKDFIVDKYVIIAPQRSKRPHTVTQDEGRQSTTKQACVFCPEAIDHVTPLYTIGPKKKNWDVKVIRNIFPAVSEDNPRAYGSQEVVIDTPDHTEQFDDLSTKHIMKIFRAYSERTKALKKNRRIQYIMIFKNSGGKAGASIQHSHSQIFATNFIPPQLVHRSQKAREYKLKTGRDVYADMIAFEERSRRLIYKDKLVSVFCPYASQNNFEVWILPRRQVDNITLLTLKERHAMALWLKRVLQKITDLHLPYNYYFHEVVNDEDQHLYVKIRPRGSVWAGVEIGSGVIINPIAPEDAAKYFRGESAA